MARVYLRGSIIVNGKFGQVWPGLAIIFNDLRGDSRLKTVWLKYRDAAQRALRQTRIEAPAAAPVVDEPERLTCQSPPGLKTCLGRAWRSVLPRAYPSLPSPLPNSSVIKACECTMQFLTIRNWITNLQENGDW